MDKIISYDQILSFINQIRSLQKGYISNFYWDSNKHPFWIANKSLEFKEAKDCILLFHRNEHFHHLYYIATDMESFAVALKGAQVNGTCVIDIVSKGDGYAETSILQTLGFQPYKRLYRMNHVGTLATTDWEADKNVMVCPPEDSERIHKMLYQGFDPLSEQLPLLQEIKDNISQQQLLIVKEGEDICGFIIYEINGFTWYLRYWYTNPAYRGKGIGAKLIKTALVHGRNTKRQILWVLADNENAIRCYEHYGFKKEQLNNYVLIKYER